MNIIRLLCLFALLGWQICVYATAVCERVLTYPSINQYGDTVYLSGKISVPASKQSKGIILLPHYTIGANKEAPSQSTPHEAKPFREDYVLIMPDYIGYGLTVDSVHPYLHGALTAQNCVDMLLHSRVPLSHLMDSIGVHMPMDSIYIVGFSQGAATALWTLQLLEMHYADRIKVKHCFIGSGPYDVASTYDEAVAANRVGMPMVVPLLVMGTNAAYDLQLQRDFFFTSALDKVYDAYIAPKNTSIVSLYMRMPNHKLSHWLTTKGMDMTQIQTQRLYDGLLRSSFVHYPLNDSLCGDSICPQWIPQTPIYVFHSKTDDVVSFCNASHLQRCYANITNITYDFGRYGGHTRSLFIFLRRVCDMLED